MTINPTNKQYGSVPSKIRPSLRLDSTIDPRQISKYLDLLKPIKLQSDKEKQIINWYYSEEIQLPLKEALMVIVGKLQLFLDSAETKLKKSVELGDTVLADCIKQLHITVNNHNFEDIDKVRDRILKRLKDDDYKSEIYNFTGEIYRNIGILSKSISNFKKSLEYNPANFNAVLNLGRLYISTEDYQLVEDLIIDAVKLFKKKTPEYLPELLNLLSQSKIYSSKYLEAKQILLQAKSFPTNNPDLKKLIDINLILVLVLNFELTEAWEMIEHVGLSISGSFNPHHPEPLQFSQIPFLYNTIAIYYAVDNQFQKSKAFAEKSFQIDEMLGNTKYNLPYHFLVINNNLAYLSIYLGDSEGFNKYNQLVRELSIDFFGSNSFAFAKSYANLGLMYLIQGKKDEAFQQFFRSFQLLSQTSQRSQLIRSAIYCDIGNIYCWQKNYDQAKIFYSKAKLIVQEYFGKNSLNLQRINAKIKTLESGVNIILPF